MAEAGAQLRWPPGQGTVSPLRFSQIAIPPVGLQGLFSQLVLGGLGLVAVGSDKQPEPVSVV